MGYCPKCGSKLFPGDSQYMEKTGVCSYCVTYDNTPDKRFRNLMYGEKQEVIMAEWICPSCQHEVLAKGRPDPIHWTDGHVCRFIERREHDH